MIKKVIIRKAVEKALESAVVVAQDIDLSGVKEKLQEKADAAKNAVKNAKLSSVDVSQVTNSLKNKYIPHADIYNEERPKEREISTEGALKIIFCLMAVDGKIKRDEYEKFDAIGNELDPRFKEKRDMIINECKTFVGREMRVSGFLNAIDQAVSEAMATATWTSNAFIGAKLLVWDMLAIAYADGECGSTERQLIEYVSKELGVDGDVLVEMETGLLTILELEKEINWIKTTDRPYLQIESSVREIERRKRIIFDSVKELISF